MNKNIAIQVYTVQSELQNDYPGTLAKLAKIGYNAIEIGGFGPYSSAEWKSVLNNTGLSIVGNHIEIELLEESFNHIIEFNLEIGNKNIVCPYIREDRRQNADGYKRVAQSLNNIGQKCANLGLQFHYHNHSFEFEKFENKTGMEILLENTDANLVNFEFDTCWLKYGGEDPTSYLKKYAGRCKLLHCKDLVNDDKMIFREVGLGIIDFKSVITLADKCGVEWYIVEQDMCSRPCLESAAISYNNIISL